MKITPLDIWGYILISIFLLLLSYAGYISYKSIDWTVLKRMETQELILPTQAPTSIPQTPTPTKTAKK